MPRKNKTAATVAENREAQRRSRARRHELIADLQSRLKEYERTGVAASIEMQRVAQAVNVENQRLKNLLEILWVCIKHDWRRGTDPRVSVVESYTVAAWPKTAVVYRATDRIDTAPRK
ncbi:hypothetical protein FPRO06_06319 [Fusarium proliferatum]|nr:hypothetical protein FPRO06_06319 [Fusarium proliferatum]